MKQVLIRKGEAVVEHVPAPRVEKGAVLVQTAYSCISTGTESSGVRETSKSIAQRALENPGHVATAVRMAAEQGIGRTLSVIRGALDAGLATGYSAAGRVVETGDGVQDISPGDRVACAGAGIAVHAEVLCVPRNLLVKVPEGLDLREACSVTLGAIALQGIRRAAPTLGETFFVLGLGILGQLTVQMLKANGCRVIGFDPDADRVRQAEDMGMDFAIALGEDCAAKVRHVTGGFGADGALITASTPSDEVVSQAFRSCRKKGRVVLVGDVGLHLKRADFYEKEIDFLISTSYGPGRYEENYERRGLDYPIGYVRWTENRNMAEYLMLLAEGKVKAGPLIDRECAVDDAASAFAGLKSGESRPLLVVLSYGAASAPLERRVDTARRWQAGDGSIRVSLVGGGDFAKTMHLPNLRALSASFSLRAVVSRSGASASSLARQFGAAYGATDTGEVFGDSGTDAVVIATRHNLHAEQASAAIRAGKHVFVEKPMALTRDELRSVVAAIVGAEVPASGPLAPWLRQSGARMERCFMVGYNRRFSRFMAMAREVAANRVNPLVITYRMNAGFIPRSHWVHTEEGGGRNIGEACHVYDLFTFLTGSEAASVDATSIMPATEQYGRNDNFVATIAFKDGSLATLMYTALGSPDFPKEEMELYCDGKIVRCSNYQKLECFGFRGKGLQTKKIDKGHRQELEAFARGIRTGDAPIPLWEQVQAAEISFSVEEQLTGGGA